MAVISEVKCGRCDRRYSGFRGRCPYCGARRSKRGKHADETENAKAKLIIGILLLVLLIAATMILILTSLPEDSEVSDPSASPTETDSGGFLPDDSDVTHIEDTTEPSPPETPTSPEIPDVEIAEVIVTYTGKPIPDNDFTLKLGESLPLGFKTIPETTDKKATWRSSDENVFMVTSDGKVTGVGAGKATLTVTVDGVTTTCT
ncbi:MAG: hypothetical protein GX847_09690, partial [Clostridiales bacterium]|nr:hypothetical protein [Clostridiales bacterium]